MNIYIHSYDNPVLFQISVADPLWFDNNTLFYISDQTNYYNLYSYNPTTDVSSNVLPPQSTDFSSPHWVFHRNAKYAKLDSKTLVISYKNQISLLDLSTKEISDLKPLMKEYTSFSNICARRNKIFALCGSPGKALSVVQYELNTQEVTVLRSSSALKIEPKFISTPKMIEFPTGYSNPDNPEYIYSFL